MDNSDLSSKLTAGRTSSLPAKLRQALFSPLTPPPMTKEEQYRRNAVEFAELAQRAASAADKAHMLRSAQAWLDRAKQSRRRVRNLGERSLVRAKFAGPA